MVDLDWLSDRLVWILRCQIDKNPETPEVPPAGQRVWGIFLDLNATRGSSGFGPLPIAYSEIESWSRLRREPVRSFELDIIRALDEAMLKAADAERTQDPGPSTLSADLKRMAAQNVSTRKLTPELFDAIFAGGKRR
jgi:hypothetical protein